jgi:hypothetical protein
MFCINSFHAHKADPKEFVRRRDGISSRVRACRILRLNSRRSRGGGQNFGPAREAEMPRKFYAKF